MGVIRIFIFSSSYLTSIHIVFYQNPNWIIITKYVIVYIQQLSIWDFMMDSVPIFYEQLHSQRPFVMVLGIVYIISPNSTDFSFLVTFPTI